MKKIHLTQRELCEMFEYRNGKLYNNYTRNGRSPKGLCINTRHKSGYIQTQINGGLYLVHRLIWLMETGNDPYPNEIDHIDHVRDNNLISNLRVVSSQDNKKNRRYGGNTSGVIGVYWYSQRKKWAAQIKVDGKNMGLGHFENKEDAIKARKSAESLHGFHKNHGGK